jgi:serine/threonine protein kinase
MNAILFVMEIINKKYKLLNRLGSGSFGSIYKGQNLRTKEYVAIKVEPINENLKLLKNESNIYQYLNDCEYIPKVKWFGKDDKNYYMVIELLNKSLQDLMNELKRFSLISIFYLLNQKKQQTVDITKIILLKMVNF